MRLVSRNRSRDRSRPSSSFNAMTVKYNHRFKEGVNVLVTYSWSKALDNVSETQVWEIRDTIDTSKAAGLRDRAIVAILIYTASRAGAPWPPSAVAVFIMPASSGC